MAPKYFLWFRSTHFRNSFQKSSNALLKSLAAFFEAVSFCGTKAKSSLASISTSEFAVRRGRVVSILERSRRFEFPPALIHLAVGGGNGYVLQQSATLGRWTDTKAAPELFDSAEDSTSLFGTRLRLSRSSSHLH